MGNILVKIGKGLLYLLVLPIFMVVIVIVMLIGLIGFIFLFIKQVFLFFTGRSLYEDLPEDIKAKAIIEAQTANQPGAQPQYQQAPQYQPQFQQPQPMQNQQGNTVINLHVTPDPIFGNSAPFIAEPEPVRPINEIPEVEQEQETPISIPDPSPEVQETIKEPVQPQAKPIQPMGTYQSGDPVFSHIDDDDIL